MSGTHDLKLTSKPNVSCVSPDLRAGQERRLLAELEIGDQQRMISISVESTW